MMLLYGGTKPDITKRFLRKLRKAIILTTSLVLMMVMCYSGIMLANTGETYQEEVLYHQALLVYKPQNEQTAATYATSVLTTPKAEQDTETVTDTKSETVENESLIELQVNYPDVIGWLTVSGTQIDYPFVQAEDNDQYLRTDLDGNKLTTGTLFMDWRVAPDLSSFNTIIYGHNMKNSSMFGSLPGFRNKETFEQYKTGTLQLPNANYTLEIFACVLTDRYDTVIYNSLQQTPEEKQAFLDYVKQNASQYRDIGVTTDNTIITLSTCSYEYADARTLLICRLVPGVTAQ